MTPWDTHLTAWDAHRTPRDGHITPWDGRIILWDGHAPPQVPADEVCGCPLVRDVFELTGDFCRVPKRRCNRHYCWEKLRRAEVDLERVRVVSGGLYGGVWGCMGVYGVIWGQMGCMGSEEQRRRS